MCLQQERGKQTWKRISFCVLLWRHCNIRVLWAEICSIYIFQCLGTFWGTYHTIDFEGKMRESCILRWLDMFVLKSKPAVSKISFSTIRYINICYERLGAVHNRCAEGYPLLYIIKSHLTRLSPAFLLPPFHLPPLATQGYQTWKCAVSWTR